MNCACPFVDWIPGTDDTCSVTTCQLVVIEGGDPCDGFGACFVTNDLGNGTFFFDNCSSNQGNGQFYWTFGDGAVSTVVNAEHSYTQAGTYEVCLYAYLENCTDTTCTTVVVSGVNHPCDELEAAFTWSTTPNGTQFSNGTTGTGQSTTWHWTFGDGITSNDGQPFHTYNFAVALEGALKLKEITYIHAEGYPAAEMKHGPIALIDANMPVVFIAPKDDIYDKIVTNIQEVRARSGRVIAIATEGDTRIESLAEHVIYVPETHPFLSPILNVLPLQLLSYYVALQRGCNVDQPRNLAKSVTVE